MHPHGMFNDKPYSSVNREERFFCALLAHALLSSALFRQRFSAFVRDHFDFSLDPARLEVYLETAALRDYWSDLGDSKTYDANTHQCRRAVLNAILSMFDFDPHIIDSTAFFWTSGPGSKLWNPGRWNVNALKDSGFEPLVQVRWAFNAKPDILLLTPTGALVIEAKVESPDGRNDTTGYDQVETQKLIVQLWQKLIPCFSSIPVRLTTLKLHRESNNGMTWSDVLTQLNGTDVDDFTNTCFQRLVQYAQFGASSLATEADGGHHFAPLPTA